MSQKRKHKSKILKKKSRLNREAFFTVLRRLGRYGVVGGVTLWFVAWVWFGGVIQSSVQWTEDKLMAMSSDAGFQVENVLVEGREHLDTKTLMEIINVQSGQALFRSDLDQIRMKIEALEWVENAVIQRRAPNDVYIKITENVPIALLKKGKKKLKLLDKNGRVIDVPIDVRFKDYLIVSGEGVEDEVYGLVYQLNMYPNIVERMDMAQWISQRRWDLITKEGIRIQMPTDDFDHGLGRLNQLQEESSILLQPLDLLDLRQGNKIIARPSEGNVLEYNHVSPASGQVNKGAKGYEL